MAKNARVNPASITLDDFELNVADPSTTDTKTVNAGEGWQTLYRRRMTDDDRLGVGDIYGRGQSANPLQAQGFAGLRFVSDAAAGQLEGKVRIAQRTPSGEIAAQGVLWEDDLESVDLFTGAAGSGTLKDRKDRQAFPQQHQAAIASPYQITIDVKPSADLTVDDAEAETRAVLEGRQVVRNS